MYSLLVTNVPYDSDENGVRLWIEGNGIAVQNVKLITDTVSGTSPSFAQVQLRNTTETDAAARRLDGQCLKNQKLRVKAVNVVDTSKPTPTLRATA